MTSAALAAVTDVVGERGNEPEEGGDDGGSDEDETDDEQMDEPSDADEEQSASEEESGDEGNDKEQEVDQDFRNKVLLLVIRLIRLTLLNLEFFYKAEYFRKIVFTPSS